MPRDDREVPTLPAIEWLRMFLEAMIADAVAGEVPDARIGAQGLEVALGTGLVDPAEDPVFQVRLGDGAHAGDESGEQDDGEDQGENESSSDHWAPSYRRSARVRVAATSLRRESGASTSTSSPQDRIQRRTSMVPETVASQRSEPSGSSRARWVGCHVASVTRDATAGEKRRRTSTSSWSAMISHAGRKECFDRVAVGCVEGLQCHRNIADPLDLERADGGPGLVPADEIQGMRLERRLDEIRPDDGLARGRIRARSRPARTRSSRPAARPRPWSAGGRAC